MQVKTQNTHIMKYGLYILSIFNRRPFTWVFLFVGLEDLYLQGVKHVGSVWVKARGTPLLSRVVIHPTTSSTGWWLAAALRVTVADRSATPYHSFILIFYTRTIFNGIFCYNPIVQYRQANHFFLKNIKLIINYNRIII